MYNMDILIFGYKLNLEVLIFIGVIYLILVGHTLCGCSRIGLMEGLEMMSTYPSGKNVDTNAKKVMATQSILGGSIPDTSKAYVTSTGKEGFAGANINYGESSDYDLSSNPTINTSAWNLQNMNVVPGKPLSKSVKHFLAREPQQIPLPEEEMLLFANTPFKPECCPNTYSNSTGCACMTGSQYNYLQTRGSNNVPYSEY